jgi:formylglycine-generating enzyme required for sulfatase activity
MKTIIKILLAAFVLSLTPTTYVSAQTKIETPAERRARLEREAAAIRKKQQQENATKRQREEAKRKRQEAEEQAAQEQAKEAEKMRLIHELESNMVFIEGGTFIMGATSDQDPDANIWEKPTHRVTLSSFHICKYEVTQELWKAVRGNNPSKFKGAKHPVEMVSWEDCQEFLSHLNELTGCQFRLPTEAEWEYAARGGSQSNGYKFAGSNSIDEVTWYGSNSGKGENRATHQVGTKRPNELGLYDMSGNVWEWCQDWWGPYSSESQTNPQGVRDSWVPHRVTRGGSWNYVAKNCRVSDRNNFEPTDRKDYVGFRIAL